MQSGPAHIIHHFVLQRAAAGVRGSHFRTKFHHAPHCTSQHVRGPQSMVCSRSRRGNHRPVGCARRHRGQHSAGARRRVLHRRRRKQHCRLRAARRQRHRLPPDVDRRLDSSGRRQTSAAGDVHFAVCRSAAAARQYVARARTCSAYERLLTRRSDCADTKQVPFDKSRMQPGPSHAAAAGRKRKHADEPAAPPARPAKRVATGAPATRAPPAGASSLEYRPAPPAIKRNPPPALFIIRA